MTDALRGLTRRGWIFLAVGGSAVIAAILAGQRDVLRVGILLVLVPLISLAVAARSRVRLTAVRTVEPTRLPAGGQTRVSIELASTARVPSGVLLVEDKLPLTLGGRPRFVLDQAWSRFRREIEYTIDTAVRGRYEIGPLTVRVADPFGMVELRRAFSDVDPLIVTPAVRQLPSVGLAGEWTGNGESRPRALANAGEEDATIRAYRLGDDVRRVHWRATAHHGELMVRREEHPWQSRAAILLDTRTSGHAGEGTDSSLEWGVTAAASIGVHLSERGYAVGLTMDTASPPASWHGLSSGQTRVAMLDALAVAAPDRSASVGNWPELLSRLDSASTLLVAVLGRLDEPEADVVASLRHGSAAAVAVLLDVMSWTSFASHQTEQARLTTTANTLRAAGWTVLIARRGDQLPVVWGRLDARRAAARAATTSSRLAGTP